MLSRLRHDDEGFALVTAIILLTVMTLLMVVALSAGNAAFNLAEGGARWSRTLGVAESGVNDAIGQLTANRTATSSCAVGDAVDVCTPLDGQDGEYQVSWRTVSGGDVEIESVGYYPTMSGARQIRKVQVLLEPIPTFRYALFSASDMEVKNDQNIAGDIYATNNVTVGQNTTICGSVISANGGVTLANNSVVLKSHTFGSGHECTDKEGLVWTGGEPGIAMSNGARVEGDAKASAPASVSPACATQTLYKITGGTVEGQATACGTITSSVPNLPAQPRTLTEPPAVVPLPAFTFDPTNYPSLNCYPSGGTCGAANTSPTAVTQFAAVSRSNMAGTYAIWQTQPTKTTRVDLDGMSLGGDLTIITNAPIDLGNTGTITTSVPGVTVVIVSLYVPPTGTTCTTNGGDCSIYGKNSIVFDSGSSTDPDDGVAGVLYTPGKMAFKNSSNSAEGALYAGSMDIKNGFDIVYNSRLERILGFGSALQQTLWRECKTTGC